MLGKKKTLWEKEKMLVTSIFSFFHFVFHHFPHRFPYRSFARVSNVALSKLFLLAPLAVGQRAYVMVRCPSCVRSSVRASVRPSVNFFYKHLLRWNYLSDFDEISQKCSHHGPLQNFLK